MKKNIKACLSKESDNWATPKFIYDQVIEKNYYDPCPLDYKEDGLFNEWKQFNFVNPPYSKLKLWVMKAIEQNKKGKYVYMLIPARTDTKAFEMLWNHGCIIWFIKGRLKFNEARAAPFPSMLVFLTGEGYSNVALINQKQIKML